MKCSSIENIILGISIKIFDAIDATHHKIDPSEWKAWKWTKKNREIIKENMDFKKVTGLGFCEVLPGAS